MQLEICFVSALVAWAVRLFPNSRTGLSEHFNNTLHLKKKYVFFELIIGKGWLLLL